MALLLFLIVITTVSIDCSQSFIKSIFFKFEGNPIAEGSIIGERKKRNTSPNVKRPQMAPSAADLDLDVYQNYLQSRMNGVPLNIIDKTEGIFHANMK